MPTRASTSPDGTEQILMQNRERIWAVACLIGALLLTGTVLPTAPDLILVHSFNEWVEGSYIEPSHRFGDRYIQLTTEWVARFRGTR